MKTRKVMAVIATVAILGTANTVWAMPLVSGVTMKQRANSRVVDIGYTLSGEAAIITLGIETNDVVIPDSAVTLLTGDVCKMVEPGADKCITWNAGADWPEHLTATAKARVTAWCTNAPPQVMVINLGGGPLTNNYPIAYYTSIKALPGGVTNTVYKSSHLVMNKIIQNRFNMGEDIVCEVILRNDFYAGVFQVTQGQWRQVMGSTRKAYFTDLSSKLYRPMEQVSYHDIRENQNNTPLSQTWPDSDEVGENSFMGLLRTRTGLSGFDLPTEAQWEYACRATTISYYNDGIGGTPNGNSNIQMNVLGRYASNGGLPAIQTSGPESGTAIVGSYSPNIWSLYDMHGNVREWCLDWYTDKLSGGTDPKGPALVVDQKRVERGGSWGRAASSASSAYRGSSTPEYRDRSVGFRLVRNITP